MLSVHASVVIMRRTNELSQITRRTAKNAAEKWSVWSGSDKKKNRENEYDDSSISFDGWLGRNDHGKKRTTTTNRSFLPSPSLSSQTRKLTKRTVKDGLL